ncbi:hypothetical protein PMG11_03002 [Penicillium brasilianum]|uniref:Uncharacterized protein n=1 Tax=Penicillium brasilianum TaxID=104259 RepID=A0A0F7VCA3_PENBI|nr:hypothetical protein PMG11_03002 [Penicillium brasilianum]
MTGSFAIRITHGITKASLSMTGNMFAGLSIGLNAFAEYDLLEKHDLYTIGIPEFSIPDIIAVGPSLALAVGANLTWSNIDAVLDLVDHSKSTLSGFVPSHSYAASFDGDVTITSTLGLPVTIGFGLNVLNGKWEKEAKLIDTPGLQATAEYDDDLSYKNGDADVTPANGCYGISWDLALANNIVLDLSEFDEGTYTLDTYTLADLASGCVGESVSNSDQTTLAQEKFVSGNDVIISVNVLEDDLPNPWADTSQSSDEKSIVMLFEYGTDLRVFVSAQNANSEYTIVPGSVSLSAYTYETTIYSKPSEANITIVSVVWGIGVITTESVYEALYDAAISGDSFEFCNTFFGDDTWYGYVKTVVIFYRDSSGNLQHLIGDESSTHSFPIASSAKKRGINLKTTHKNLVSHSATPQFGTVPVHVPHQPQERSWLEKYSPYSHGLLSRRSENSTLGSNSTSSNTTDDTYGTVTITDTASIVYLNPSVNGSMFVSLVSGSTNLTALTDDIQFVADLTEGVILGDSSSRLLYYFPDTMSAVGSSRLRLGAWGEIPNTANLINLVPMSDGSEDILVAIDTLGNYYWPFVCAIQDQLNKVFLVQDYEMGASVLEGADPVCTVAGGVASNCSALALEAEGL